MMTKMLKLYCDLTVTERLERSDAMAQQVAKIEELEAQKKSVDADINGKIKLAEEVVHRLGRIVRDKKEERQMENGLQDKSPS